jgi:hypothetical protein
MANASLKSYNLNWFMGIVAGKGYKNKFEK